MENGKVRVDKVDENNVKTLQVLIEALTHSGLNALDEDEFKKVKKICKSCQSYIKITYDLILNQLKKKNSQIRFLAFQMCIELFTRSVLFRNYVLKDLKLIFKLTAEVNSKVVLPPPKSFAKKLKDLAVKTLKIWVDNYGEEYKELKIAYNYLNTCMNINFETGDTRTETERQEENDKERRLKLMFEERKKIVMEEIKSYETEMEETIITLSNCLKLLLPTPEEFFIPEESIISPDNKPKDANTSALTVDKEEVSLIDIKHLGITPDYSLKLEIQPHEKIKIIKTEENISIIQNSKDCIRLINNRFLPIIKKWCYFFCKYSSENSNELKKILDLKERLQNILNKYLALNIDGDSFIKKNNESSEDDDSDFEEVKKEGYEDFAEFTEEDIFFMEQKKNKNIIKTNTNDDVKNDNKRKAESICSPGSSKEDDSNKCDRKSKLLKIAPVLPFDIDLYHWEDEKLTAPTLISTKMDVDKFWGCSESDEIHEIPNPDGVAALRTRVIEFAGKFEPVKWACRAPLSNGKLCPRKDRYKCPFHGKIVPRDEFGNLQDNNGKSDSKQIPENTSAVSDWQDPQLLAEIKEATGINLKMPEIKGKRKKTEDKNLTHKQMKTSAAALKIAKRKNYTGLIDVVKRQNNHYARLSKKIFNKSAMKRVSAALNKIHEKKLNEKFGDCFNY